MVTKAKISVYKDYALIILFGGAVVTGGWNIRETKAMSKKLDRFDKRVYTLEEFKEEQVGINKEEGAIILIFKEVAIKTLTDD